MNQLFSAPRRPRAVAAALLLFVVAGGGCGGRGDETAPVSNRSVAPANSPTAIITNTNTPVAQVPSPVPSVITNTGTPTAANANVSAQPSPGGEEFAAARGLYTQNCAACHGPGGAGQKIGALVYPSLKGGEVLTMTDAQITNYIANGVPEKGMPAYKNKFTPQQIQGMVRYIRQELQGKK